ncbi:MAG: hypothetical protein Q4G69_09310 [Planctomycetia bacterium]|nr:hypothetical protein [Planctomycetia bacterium]
MKKTVVSFLRSHALWILFTGFFLLFFSSVIFFDRQFCFRDDSYFYYPYFEYIQNCWKQGDLPLWDPCLNLGYPLAAVPTSTVFYPFKLLFFLPVSYDILYKWYILIHIPIAFFGICSLMRNWCFSWTASALAAFSYTFSGSIFFQYSNVVFLIGAAWIPWTVYAGDLLIRKRTLASFLGLGGTLAMMVLGGDPLAAYFSGLILFALLFFYWKGNFFVRKETDPCESKKYCFLKNPLLLLILAAIFGGGLSAVQVLPTMELSKTADRSARAVPLSIWEIPKFLKDYRSGNREDLQISQEEYIRKMCNLAGSDDKKMIQEFRDFYQKNNAQNSASKFVLDGIFGRDIKKAGGHYQNIYRFSIAPWDLLGLIWPNFTGNTSPYNGKWSNGLPNNPLWICSLYMGFIPFLLAVFAFRLWKGRIGFGRKKSPKLPATLHSVLRAWASWGAMIAILGGLGLYGPLWFARLVCYMAGSDSSLQLENYDPVGTVYWFMVVFLPKFASFRYPGKLIVPMMFFLAVLAALGWDSLRKNKKLLSLIQLAFTFSLLIMIYVLWEGKELFCLASVPQSDFFGAYCPEVAWKNVLCGSISTLCLSGILYLLLWTNAVKSIANRWNLPVSSRWITSGAVLLIVSLDLYVNNQPLVFTAPNDIYRKTSSVAKIIREDFYSNPENRESGLPPRIYRNDFYPASFMNSRKTSHRLAERTLWENASLMPNYNYFYDLCIINAMHGSISDNQFYTFYPSLNSRAKTEEAAEIFAFLGISYAILPTPESSASVQKYARYIILAKYEEDLAPEVQLARRFPQAVQVMKTAVPASRIRIYHDASMLKDDKKEIENMIEKKQWGDPLPGEFARIARFGQNRMDYEIRLEKAATLLAPDLFDPGWKAFAWKKGEKAFEIPIKKTLGFMRKFELPEGEYSVQMVYDPFFFKLGWKISLFSLIFGLFLLVRRKKRKKY